MSGLQPVLYFSCSTFRNVESSWIALTFASSIVKDIQHALSEIIVITCKLSFIAVIVQMNFSSVTGPFSKIWSQVQTANWLL